MKDSGDYISREAVIEAIEETDWYHQGENMDMIHGANSLEHQAWYKEQDVYAAIKSIPASDVRPVVRGKWIDHQMGRWVYAKCSECETVHDVRSNFCPTCGADMRPEPPREEE